MGFGRAFTGGFQSGVQSGQASKRAAAAEQARQDQLGFQESAEARAERQEARAAAAQAEALTQSRAAFAEQQRIIARQREFEAEAADALKTGNVGEILQKYPDKAANIQALMQAKQQINTMQAQGVDVRRAAGQGYNAVVRGDIEGAKNIVKANKNIIEGAGDPSFTVDRMLELLDTDPGQAAQMMRGLYSLSGGNAESLLGVKGKLTSYQAAQVALKQQEIAIKQAKNEREAKAEERDKATEAAKAEALQKEIQILDQKIATNEQEAKEAVASKQAAFDTMNEVVSIATELQNPKGLGQYLSQVVGPLDTMFGTYRGTSQDVINAATRLKNLLTLDNLDLMTGVLSESDIKILASAASGLNVTDKGILGSMPGITAELKRIVDVTNKAIARAQSEGKLNGLQGPPGTSTTGGSGTTATGIPFKVVQ